MQKELKNIILNFTGKQREIRKGPRFQSKIFILKKGKSHRKGKITQFFIEKNYIYIYVIYVYVSSI